MDKWDKMAAADAAEREEEAADWRIAEAVAAEREAGEAKVLRAMADLRRLRDRLEKAEHWAKHAVLMHSCQNEELLRILRGED